MSTKSTTAVTTITAAQTTTTASTNNDNINNDNINNDNTIDDDDDDDNNNNQREGHGFKEHLYRSPNDQVGYATSQSTDKACTWMLILVGALSVVPPPSSPLTADPVADELAAPLPLLLLPLNSRFTNILRPFSAPSNVAATLRQAAAYATRSGWGVAAATPAQVEPSIPITPHCYDCDLRTSTHFARSYSVSISILFSKGDKAGRRVQSAYSTGRLGDQQRHFAHKQPNGMQQRQTCTTHT